MRVARLVVVASLVGLFLCSLTSRSSAQLTTSTVRGTVKSADDGVPMAEVEVTLVDESTGSVKTASTNTDGSFAFNNLQVGGPYHITATVNGFKSAEEKNIFLTANRTQNVSLALHLQEEVIEVSSNAIPRNTSNRTVVTAAEIDELPSVNRDPRDVVRRNPEVTVEGGARALSIGGANNRYNSITIDGVREDDDFGLNASGYPTRRSPIALSAVQELTVDTSPFDVRYGKFLGGNVNIVTKSGTNEFKGQLVGTFASDALLGSHSGNRTINVDYSEYRYGVTVGGPIIKDKLHFLASVEGLAATTPINNGPAGSGASTEVTQVAPDDVSRAQAIAREVYGFDPGVASQSGKERDLKLLGKLDYTISPEHRASVIYQRTGGNNIQVGNTATSSLLPLSSNWYNAQDTLNTFTGRVFSDWSDQLSTEVEANVKLVSSRVPSLKGNDFMAAIINTVPPSGMGGAGSIRLGPDPSRHSNLLDNDVYHTKAEANYLLGTHLFTGGLEYERTYIDNLFIQNSLGTATYASLDAFEAKTPTQIVYQNSTTLNPADAAANWHVGLWTTYLQDQIKLSPDLTLQGGLRFEQYQTGSRPSRNQNFVNRYDFENNGSLNARNILQPRLGLSWQPMNNLNVRAGAGLYSGGTPAVWMSNNYTNDGVRTFSVTSRDAKVINGFDGRNIPDALKTAVMNGAGNGNVDVLDPDFKIPSVWKIGTGADYSLDIPGAGDYGKNIELKANYTFTKVNNGVNWLDLRRNLDDPAFPNNLPVGNTVDGRALYAANFNTSRGFDMELTNDSRGYAHVASGVIQKGFPFGLFVAGSYAYTDNQEVSPGTSSVSTSNYGIVAVSDPNHPGLAVSNYERKHRFTAALEYSHSIIGELTDSLPWKDMKTSVGMFLESRSGQAYSWTFSGRNEMTGATDNTGQTLSRIFGEDSSIASRNRELFFVPTDAATCEETFTAGCQVVLKGITKDQFNTFLNRSGLASYRGKIAPRNGFDGPWYNRLDLRFAQDLPNPLSGQRARFVVDIENFGNLLSHNWGLFRQVPFPFYTPAVDVSVDRTNGSYVYSSLRSPNPTSGPSTTDLLLSVWRVSIGLMYDF
jgi:outer membrane receptor for ferrienterochelin and colicin